MEKLQLFTDLPTLETERLILRKFSKSDAISVFEFTSDPKVTQYLTWNNHQSIEETFEFIKIVHNSYATGQPAPWAIESKALKKVIGSIGIVEMNTFFRRAEIGFLLNRKFWRKGYSYEAILKVIEFCFQETDIHRVEATCEVPNTSSANILQKAGMRYEGILQGYGVNNNQPVDMKMFSILKPNWELPQ